jgi:hypothetical protein
MRKIIALFLVFSVLSLSVNLMAKEKRGADILIQKKDGQQVRGELIAVKKDSLLLKETASGVDVSVDVNDMRTITILKKSKTLKNGAIGLLIGGVVGVAAGYFYDYSRTYTMSSWLSTLERKGYEYLIIPGFIGAAIGALVGVATGASAGKDNTIQVEGKSDSEIKEIMEELRKKARIPNFQ